MHERGVMVHGRDSLLYESFVPNNIVGRLDLSMSVGVTLRSFQWALMAVQRREMS
jgi:hypothetical protein